MRRVLVVDDEPHIRAVLRGYLEADGFAVSEAADGEAAVRQLHQQSPDLVLLDVMLPGMDGLEVLRQVRTFSDVYVILVTARAEEVDKLVGLGVGADDYVTKPFRLSVLLARLRAHLRQSDQSDAAVFTIGPYTFRPGAKLLTDQSGRKKVRLTEKETAILKYLYRAGDRVIGRDTLLGEVWGYNAGVTTHTLETHVYRLRQKIERDPARAEILVTEPGGYRLVP